MFISVAHPEFLKITDLQTNQSFLGGAQEWYSSEWGRRAGCGPTCAANLSAYLALTRPELRALYHGKDMDRVEFLRHMGSSSSRTLGSGARARATATRCCCPPESS